VQATCITGKSLGLLPPGESKKKCYRIVVGADTGIITCFRIKKGEVCERHRAMYTNLQGFWSWRQTQRDSEAGRAGLANVLACAQAVRESRTTWIHVWEIHCLYPLPPAANASPISCSCPHVRVCACSCARVRLAQAEVEFTTNNLDYPVARLMIGGPADKKDRIFFSSAQSIRGVTRKGKEFFRFATDGAEVCLAYA
jgi:hypothetical protein